MSEKFYVEGAMISLKDGLDTNMSRQLLHKELDQALDLLTELQRPSNQEFPMELAQAEHRVAILQQEMDVMNGVVRVFVALTGRYPDEYLKGLKFPSKGSIPQKRRKSKVPHLGGD
jgi:hypothetical protein